MKKFTEFLEKNCQWLAIGAGALYLVWMVYSNLLTNTAWTVTVGNEPKSPGEVDQAVAQIAEQLKDKMDHGPVVKIPVPDFEKTAIDLSPKKLPEYAIAWANSPTQDVPMPAPQGQQPNPATPTVATNTGGAATNKVVELPKAPAPTDLMFAMGIANALIPPPIDPTNPGNAPAMPTTGTDIPWVTWSFKVSLADLAKEFQRTNIPPANPQQQAFTTSFLLVELVRQEQMTDGSWGPSTVCPKLTTDLSPPFPSDKSSRQEMQTYVNWADSNGVQVLQPPFYQVVKGDPWTLSKDLIGNGVVGANGAPIILDPINGVRDGFDPKSFINLDPKEYNLRVQQMNPPLTMAEKRAIAKAKSDDAAQKAAEKAKSRAPGFGGARGAGGRGGATDYAPEDGYRPGGGPRIPRGPGFDGDIPDMGGQMGYNQTQPSNFSQMFPLPQGEFDPRTLVTANAAVAGAPPGNQNMTNVVAWAHDWKAQPGHTYRYMVRYKIKNPVWLTGNVTKEKAMADQFAITSVESAWTQPVTVPSVVRFYFASAGGIGGSKARVQVYRWQDGETHRQEFSVMPGDAIGNDASGVDYNTGWTLVDLRPEPKGDRTVAWLLNADGNLVKRDVKADVDDPQKKELDNKINSAAAAAAAANGGAAAGGAPGMINPTQ